MFRWVSMVLLCMHKVFHAGRGKQMIMTSLGDVPVVTLM